MKYIGQESVQQDIANLKAAMAGKDVAGGVLMSIAPGTIEHWMHNEHYGSEEDFLMAIADAMHDEYKAITDAGLIVQIDDPDLADGWQVYPEMSVAEYHAYADVRVEAMNRASRGINPEQVILHVCWGSFHTPHTNDLPLREIIDLFFKVNSQGVSIEQSNPRHEHEWAIFKDIKLPAERSSSLASSATSRTWSSTPSWSRSAWSLRQSRRPRERHRGHGLRHRHARRARRGRLGEARRNGRRRPHRVEGALGE